MLMSSNEKPYNTPKKDLLAPSQKYVIKMEIASYKSQLKVN